jgi:uncharacterized protein with HEPN domain
VRPPVGNDRIERWLGDLESALDDADEIIARGRAAFDDDRALPLACEALCNRVGDLAKKLVAADAALFAASVWKQAARNRDFVVHHYHRVDRDVLWETVAVAFPQLRTHLGELERD